MHAMCVRVATQYVRPCLEGASLHAVQRYGHGSMRRVPLVPAGGQGRAAGPHHHILPGARLLPAQPAAVLALPAPPAAARGPRRAWRGGGAGAAGAGGGGERAPLWAAATLPQHVCVLYLTPCPEHLPSAGRQPFYCSSPSADLPRAMSRRWAAAPPPAPAASPQLPTWQSRWSWSASPACRSPSSAPVPRPRRPEARGSSGSRPHPQQAAGAPPPLRSPEAYPFPGRAACAHVLHIGAPLLRARSSAAIWGGEPLTSLVPAHLPCILGDRNPSNPFLQAGA